MWTMTRTVCQPLVVAKRYARDCGVGLGLTTPFGIATATYWVLLCFSTSVFFRMDFMDIVYFGDGGLRPGNVLVAIVLDGLSRIWGIVIFVLAIYAVNFTRTTLDPPYRVVPKIIIAVSLIWIVRLGLIMTSYWGVLNMYRLPRSVSLRC